MADTYSTKKITDLTENTSANDTDLYVLGNAGTSTMRKITFANIAAAIRNKLTTLTFSGFTTSAKTIPGAVNELNSKISGISVTVISNENITISAESYVDINETLSRSGYTPLGVVGWALYGSSACYAIYCRVLSGDLTMRIKNTSSSSVTLTGVYATVLWAKD